MKCAPIYEANPIKSITYFDIFGIESKQDLFLFMVQTMN